METRICCTNLSLMPHCLCILFNGFVLKNEINPNYFILYIYQIVKQSKRIRAFLNFIPNFLLEVYIYIRLL